jgi:hypothetical protein
MIPRLGTLWNGKWTYSQFDGVGLRFEGLPTDVDAFVLILASYGCHPKATERILNRLRSRGYDELTVMSHLDFISLAQDMNKLSVAFSIIPPLENWTEKYEDGAFEKDILDKAFRLHEERRDRLPSR